MSRYCEIFKGFVDACGKVMKQRVIGYALMDETSEMNKLFIYAAGEDSFMLVAEKDPNEEHDFIITKSIHNSNCKCVARKLHKRKKHTIVGIGKLLTGRYFGLIKLEWDLWGGDNIYLSFSSADNIGNQCKFVA